MKTVIKSLCVSGLVLALPLASASALTSAEIKQCRAMGASLQVRQAELAEADEARLTLAEVVEFSGEIWEAAEATRNFGEAEAAEADRTKADYESQRADFIRKDMAFQSNVAQLNQDLAAYNALCARN